MSEPLTITPRIQGNILRNMRASRNLTLRELSVQCNVSLAYLSEIENGRKESSSAILTSVLTALDIPLSQFYIEIGYAYRKKEMSLTA